jgi:histidinol dehydrogenase/sulfopropanediol 3-dehydrogenase
MQLLKEPNADPFADFQVPAGVQDTVSEIIQDVENDGDEAVHRLTRKFDDVSRESVRLSSKEESTAIEELSDEAKRIIDKNINNIQRFAEIQYDHIDEFETEVEDGIILGQKTIPIERIGAYVPGGQYPLLSSALMTVIPAAVAGVDNISVATPPQDNGVPHSAVIYGARQAGADDIFVMGGAQAVAAMAVGTEEVLSNDKIVGPGNIFVTEAKRQLFGKVGLDLLAGPSEILVLADHSGDPETIAADLLAQAEHDVAARPLAVTTSEAVGQEIIHRVNAQLEDLETVEVAGESWQNMGTVVLVEDLSEAVDVVDRFAPEHLEIQTNNPRDLLDSLSNYGTLFLGENSANVFSDKLIGTNHTLPTQRAARYTAGLSVHTFVKKPTYQEVSDEGVQRLEPWATKQSTLENLIGHAKSSYIRAEENELTGYEADNIELQTD